MCGRFAFYPTLGFYDQFDLPAPDLPLTHRYNVAPGHMVPVVVRDDATRLVSMRWGLVPSWSKEEKTAYKMINARVETLTQKAFFRTILRTRRCLVPASGFYEWQKSGSQKIPHYIHPTDEQPMAFAGLYDVWKDPEGQDLLTFTIITREADTFMARLHTRMPVILRPEVYMDWLNPALRDDKGPLQVLTHGSDVALEAYPVSKQVNRVSEDSKTLIDRVEDLSV